MSKRIRERAGDVSVLGERQKEHAESCYSESNLSCIRMDSDTKARGRTRDEGRKGEEARLTAKKYGRCYVPSRKLVLIREIRCDKKSRR